MIGGKTLNLVFKKMLKVFLKIQENIRISIMKRRLGNLQKEKLKPEIKPIIEDLQDELCQLENKQTKNAKLSANIRWEDGSWQMANFLQSTSKTEYAKSNYI